MEEPLNAYEFLQRYHLPQLVRVSYEQNNKSNRQDLDTTKTTVPSAVRQSKLDKKVDNNYRCNERNNQGNSPTNSYTSISTSFIALSDACDADELNSISNCRSLSNNKIVSNECSEFRSLFALNYVNNNNNNTSSASVPQSTTFSDDVRRPVNFARTKLVPTPDISSSSNNSRKHKHKVSINQNYEQQQQQQQQLYSSRITCRERRVQKQSKDKATFLNDEESAKTQIKSDKFESVRLCPTSLDSSNTKLDMSQPMLLFNAHSKIDVRAFLVDPNNELSSRSGYPIHLPQEYKGWFSIDTNYDVPHSFKKHLAQADAVACKYQSKQKYLTSIEAIAQSECELFMTRDEIIAFKLPSQLCTMSKSRDNKLLPLAVTIDNATGTLISTSSSSGKHKSNNSLAEIVLRCGQVLKVCGIYETVANKENDVSSSRARSSHRAPSSSIRAPNIVQYAGIPAQMMCSMPTVVNQISSQQGRAYSRALASQDLYRLAALEQQQQLAINGSIGQWHTYAELGAPASLIVGQPVAISRQLSRAECMALAASNDQSRIAGLQKINNCSSQRVSVSQNSKQTVPGQRYLRCIVLADKSVEAFTSTSGGNQNGYDYGTNDRGLSQSHAYSETTTSSNRQKKELGACDKGFKQEEFEVLIPMKCAGRFYICANKQMLINELYNCQVEPKLSIVYTLRQLITLLSLSQKLTESSVGSGCVCGQFSHAHSRVCRRQLLKFPLKVNLVIGTRSASFSPTMFGCAPNVVSSHIATAFNEDCVAGHSIECPLNACKFKSNRSSTNNQEKETNLACQCNEILLESPELMMNNTSKKRTVTTNGTFKQQHCDVGGLCGNELALLSATLSLEALESRDVLLACTIKRNPLVCLANSLTNNLVSDNQLEKFKQSTNNNKQQQRHWMASKQRLTKDTCGNQKGASFSRLRACRSLISLNGRRGKVRAKIPDELMLNDDRKRIDDVKNCLSSYDIATISASLLNQDVSNSQTTSSSSSSVGIDKSTIELSHQVSHLQSSEKNKVYLKNSVEEMKLFGKNIPNLEAENFVDTLSYQLMSSISNNNNYIDTCCEKIVFVEFDCSDSKVKFARTFMESSLPGSAIPDLVVKRLEFCKKLANTWQCQPKLSYAHLTRDFDFRVRQFCYTQLNLRPQSTSMRAELCANNSTQIGTRTSIASSTISRSSSSAISSSSVVPAVSFVGTNVGSETSGRGSTSTTGTRKSLSGGKESERKNSEKDVNKSPSYSETKHKVSGSKLAKLMRIFAPSKTLEVSSQEKSVEKIRDGEELNNNPNNKFGDQRKSVTLIEEMSGKFELRRAKRQQQQQFDMPIVGKVTAVPVNKSWQGEDVKLVKEDSSGQQVLSVGQCNEKNLTLMNARKVNAKLSANTAIQLNEEPFHHLNTNITDDINDSIAKTTSTSCKKNGNNKPAEHLYESLEQFRVSSSKQKDACDNSIRNTNSEQVLLFDDKSKSKSNGIQIKEVVLKSDTTTLDEQQVDVGIQEKQGRKDEGIVGNDDNDVRAKDKELRPKSFVGKSKFKLGKSLESFIHINWPANKRNSQAKQQQQQQDKVKDLTSESSRFYGNEDNETNKNKTNLITTNNNNNNSSNKCFNYNNNNKQSKDDLFDDLNGSFNSLMEPISIEAAFDDQLANGNNNYDDDEHINMSTFNTAKSLTNCQTHSNSSTDLYAINGIVPSSQLAGIDNNLTTKDEEYKNSSELADWQQFDNIHSVKQTKSDTRDDEEITYGDESHYANLNSSLDRSIRNSHPLNKQQDNDNNQTRRPDKMARRLMRARKFQNQTATRRSFSISSLSSASNVVEDNNSRKDESDFDTKRMDENEASDGIERIIVDDDDDQKISLNPFRSSMRKLQATSSSSSSSSSICSHKLSSTTTSSSRQTTNEDEDTSSGLSLKFSSSPSSKFKQEKQSNIDDIRQKCSQAV